MLGLNVSDAIQTLTGSATLVIIIWTVFWKIKEPNVNQDEKIARMDQTISGLGKSVLLIQENHLPHIEKNVEELKLNVREIVTIINERIPKRKDV